MSVEGALVARGTAAEPIVFTGLVKQTGSWGGLNASYTAEQRAALTFDHVVVEYAEIVNLWAGGNVDLGYAVADIDNSVFRYGGSNGIAADMGTVLTLRNSSFNGNTLNAVWYEGGVGADPVLSNLSASDNKQFNAVVYRSVNVTQLHRLESMGLPYVLAGGMEVEEGGELVIDPGVELRVDTGFYVRGTMRALGSATQPILITGIKQEPAGWWGLSVSSGTTSIANLQLDHVTIEYGGSGSDYGGNLVVSSANVTVTNSILRNSGSHGIYNDGGAPDETFAVKVSNTIISGNQMAAIVCADESCNYAFDNLTVNGNGMDGIVYRSAMWSSGTWRNLGIPYIVEGHAGVANGATLTIEPGVEVRMAKDATFSGGRRVVRRGHARKPDPLYRHREAARLVAGHQDRRQWRGRAALLRYRLWRLCGGGIRHGAGHDVQQLAYGEPLSHPRQQWGGDHGTCREPGPSYATTAS